MLSASEQLAMLAQLGEALTRGTSGFTASSAYDHFHLRETAQTKLTAGGQDPLLPLLADKLDQARSVDLAVAFAMDSGVALLEPWFRDLLKRGGRLRIVVGDYLDTTDPAALGRLLDLEGAELHVFETAGISFHPKAWLFRATNSRGAIVGSSNLSQSALTNGVEWNLHAEDVSGEIAGAFEALLMRPEVQPLTAEWVERYSKRRRARPLPEFTAKVVQDEGPAPEPHAIQEEALEALAASRVRGHRAGLVVLATGLGKTWLAAFDTLQNRADRILFVAHRDEILTQAMSAFRKVRPDARLGRYTGQEKDGEADILFASIQTLGRLAHLRQFAPDRFDYIVVDEFHHAAARSYQNLIDHFTPRFLLGLTATPDRTDGGDLLGLCGENLVYQCGLFDGIDRGHLSPFHYFGVPDDVDYAQIPWRSGQFDPAELETAMATEARAQNAYEQFQNRAKGPAIGFCVSKRHADYMAEFFQARGLRAVAVHSGENSSPRASSLFSLGRGELDILFAVDMFNEGVDVPEIGTVMMLRPTESAIIWLQQLGRGLRRIDGKVLQVIDYIGNHRVFLTKAAALLQAGGGDRSISRRLDDLTDGTFELPAGCEITYELEAIDILRGLLRTGTSSEALEAFYRDFRDQHGKRPTAVEAYRAGHDPRATGHGTWFDFVRDMSDALAERPFATHSQLIGEVSRAPRIPRDAIVALRAILHGDPPGVGKAHWELSRHFAHDGNQLRLARPDPSGELVPLLDELIDWRSAAEPAPEAEAAEPTVGVWTGRQGLVPWQRYIAPDIAANFGLEYVQNTWRTGMRAIADQNVMVLLAGILVPERPYPNEFLDDRHLRWFSQNQTKQESKHGRIISGEAGHQIHLFVRRGNKVNGKVNPFIYAGQPKFIRWEGEQPITVEWELPEAVPTSLWAELGVPG